MVRGIERAILMSALMSASAHASPASLPDPLAVKVNLILSPKATAHVARGYALKCQAIYRGEPIPAKRKLAEEQGGGPGDEGFPYIGESKSVLVSHAGILTIPSPQDARAKVGWVMAPLVTVNAIQAKMPASERTDFVTCMSDETSMAHAQKSPVVVRCQMVSEGFN